MPEGAEAAESLTGVWHGQYAYPVPWMSPAHFTCTIVDSGGTLSGMTHETTQKGAMVAVVDGALEGGVVRFVKVYQPASEEYQDVYYYGSINADRTEIEGEWTVPDVWSGRFLMIRSRSTAKAEERSAALTG